MLGGAGCCPVVSHYGRDMGAEPLSEAEQDNLVVELAVNIETFTEEEFEERYNQLDNLHKAQVNADVREFADNAVGDEHWDSDETG